MKNYKTKLIDYKFTTLILLILVVVLLITK